MSLKISLVTATYNSSRTLQDTVLSVISQDYSNIEYIMVDGNSSDATVDIIRKFEEKLNMQWISEPDIGLYDAINKGIAMATGDVVGILNSDDFFYNEKVLSRIAMAFEDPGLEVTIGDIVFIKGNDPDKTIRRYSAKKWRPSRFAWGYMPPHPSFFAKRKLFEKFGNYQTDYKIAADYELLIRFLLKNKVKWKYLPIITTKMRMGGASTSGIKSLLTLNEEIARGCKENGVYTNYAMIYSKYLFKPFEFIFK